MGERWSRPSVALHWIGVALLAGMVTAGWVMSDLPPTSAGRLWLSRLHTVFGLTLVGLTAARLVVRRRVGKPSPLAVPSLHRRGVGAVHALMYATLFAIGASGFITARSSVTWHDYLLGDLAEPPLLEQYASRGVHAGLVITLLVLVGLHVGGVLLQELRGGGILRRMVPFLE